MTPGHARGPERSGRPLHPLTLYAVPRLFKWAMLPLMASCRLRQRGAEHVQTLARQGTPWVYCSWHNNIAMGICRLRGRRIAMMASASRDGELIAAAIAAFGNTSVRGSTSFRGSQAARDMARTLKRGANGAISPDGPRGPAYRCQSGALWVAAMSGCALVPYELDASRQWRLNSWDRHKIPKPFACLHEHFGAPLFVRRDELTDPATLARFEQCMLANTLACRRAAGHGDTL